MNAPFSPLDRTDEIDLIDLWLVFKRRWLWVVMAMGLCLAAALGWGLLQKPVITYQISLQLGALILDGRVMSLEEPEVVKTAVQQRSAMGALPPISVGLTRGSDVINLSRTGSEAQAASILASLTSQAQTILADQARLQAAYQDQLNRTTQEASIITLFRPARVLAPAAPAGVDAPPALPLLGMLGLMLGLMLGCGAILLAEFFAAVRQREQQQSKFRPLSVEPLERKPAVTTARRASATR